MIVWMSQGTHRSCRATVALVLALAAAACGDSPAAPTPPVALDLTCPAAVSAVATSTAGAAVAFPLPAYTGGQAPVTVSCSADSGRVFPVGLTQVTCTARDRSSQLAACAFDVRVTNPPRLSLTRFLAFGDSITAGEITSPLATEAWQPLLVVPSLSYPTILQDRLRVSYPLQAPTVANAGFPGVAVGIAFNRFLTELNRVQPEVVLLVMGYNDLDKASDVAFGANVLDSMVREARGRGARVFLGTLTPTITGRLRSVDPVLLDSMNVRIRRIAADRGAVLVDLFEGFQPAVFTWVGVDGIHPTEAGYVRIAELFFAAIRASLEVAPTPTAITALGR